MRPGLLAALGVLLSLSTAAAGPEVKTDRWRRLYFYDQLKSSLVINDFKFLSRTHGVAVGFLQEEQGKLKPVSLATLDGGVHWTLTPLHEIPISEFFYDDKHGWIVGDKAIWQSTDGGRDWRKLAALDNADRVWFASPEHGWAVGEGKNVYETLDGGREWKAMPVAKTPESAESTVYNWIDFASPLIGIITGWNPPEGVAGRLPEWMNPAAAKRRRETPRVSIFLQTRDGGKTWDATTGSLFGHVSCVRLSPAGFGLGVIEFTQAFDWPSEVFRIDWTTGKSERVFRLQNRLITDVAIPRSGPSYLAGIEKLDRLSDSPLPGKVKVYRSDDLDNWTEMDVDYRAVAHRVMLSGVDEQNIWLATDTGTILKLTPSK